MLAGRKDSTIRKNIPETKMESQQNEAYSGNKPSIRSRVGEPISRVSSKLRSFWISFGCLFHFSCFYESVEVQTEEDVARFIAKSLKAAKRTQTCARDDSEFFEESSACRGTGRSGQAEKPRKPVSTVRFMNLVENYGHQNAVSEGHQITKEFAVSHVVRVVKVENGQVQKSASVFTSLGNETAAESGQSIFRSAPAQSHALPFAVPVILNASEARYPSHRGHSAINEACEGNAVLKGKYAVENGGLGKSSGSEWFPHASLADWRVVETQPWGAARDSDKAEDVLFRIGSRTGLVGSRGRRRVRGGLIPVRVAAERQAGHDIARCTADQTDAARETVLPEGDRPAVHTSSEADDPGQRGRRYGFRGVRKRFCRRVRKLYRQVIHV